MKKIFRKFHLWLSVPLGIFITLICFSGATLPLTGYYLWLRRLKNRRTRQTRE